MTFIYLVMKVHLNVNLEKLFHAKIFSFVMISY